MIINALNSGASVFMADFEDANTPTWSNLIDGHINLRDAIRRTITYTDPSTGKAYKLNPQTAVLLVRPRGWHLPEKHVLVDGQPMSGAIFDFALYFWHNAKELLARGTGPYFYLPKIESHLEARLWNDVFIHAQEALGIKRGTIKATVLIETILATFELDEILWELREHSSGLNCGRWDYIFSFIKKFASDPAAILPDRGRVTMTTHFMRSYSKLVIKTCHRREVHAMGGMSAYIPNKRDPVANQTRHGAGSRRQGTRGLRRPRRHLGRASRPRGAGQGSVRPLHAHSRTRSTANSKMCTSPRPICSRSPRPTSPRPGCARISPSASAIWSPGCAAIGCVPLFNLMEDAATAEISRAQLWQWVHQKAKLNDGRPITLDLCLKTIDEELAKFRQSVGEQQFRAGRYEDAANLLRDLIRSERFVEFLTLPAYDRLAEADRVSAD